MPSLTPSGGSAINFLFWRGVMPNTRTRVETWQVPGVNGYGAILLGNGDSDGSAKAEYFALSDTYANQFWQAIVACQGKICTLVDDFGDTVANLLVTKVGQPAKKAMIAPSSGSIYSGIYVTIELRTVTIT
jgi:hypothetical protein